jgi:broad specificity phosphatase PhoE
MSSSLQIYFIRHGETSWSPSGQSEGQTDLPLTPHGEAMARELAPVLKAIPFSLVLTSPLLRARETCELAGFGDSGHVKAQIEPSLTEWDYGDYEDWRSADIRKLHPDWNTWENGGPGGETPEDVGTRADLIISRLQNNNGKVALFSHGQFGRVLAARWIGLPVTEGQHFTLAPASISILGFEIDYPQRRVISLWNALPANFLDVQSPGIGIA